MSFGKTLELGIQDLEEKKIEDGFYLKGGLRISFMGQKYKLVGVERGLGHRPI
jgi:hypothetical protein